MHYQIHSIIQMDGISDSVSEGLSSPELSRRSGESYQSSKLKFSIQNILRPDFGKVRKSVFIIKKENEIG